MNLLFWLDALATPASAEAASRRAALSRLGRAAAIAAPTLTVSQRALAGTDSLITAGLNLWLRVAQLKLTLLDAGLTNLAALPADGRATVQAARGALVELIAGFRAAIERSGDAAEAPRTYDFTGGAGSQAGPLAPLSSYADFLLLAQTLADLLVRTLIGQLGTLTASGQFADLAAQSLGTTSRIAALLRRRGASLISGPRLPWVEERESTVTLPALMLSYVSEDTVNQFGIYLPGVEALKGRAPETYTAAFDEPLNAEEVSRALAPFLAV